jgi:hypothetical protein
MHQQAGQQTASPRSPNARTARSEQGEFVAKRTDRCGMGAFELLAPLLACRARLLGALALGM